MDYTYGSQEAQAYKETRLPYTNVADFLLTYISSNKFLDAGCGTGNDLLEIYRRKGYKGYGCDRSSDMLEVAKSVDCATDLRQADLDKEFPFNLDFDCIYAHDVIHHLKDPSVFIKNAFNHLTTGKVLIIGTETEEDLKAKFTSRYFPSALGIDLARYSKLAEMEKLIKEAGFAEFEVNKLDDNKPMDDTIMQQVRKRAHSILGLISDQDFSEGLAKLEKDYADGKLQQMPWNYTLIVAKK